MNNYKILEQKLERFIRKFYINKLIKGGLLSLCFLLLSYLFVITFEYFAYSTIITRTILFYGFTLVSVVLFLIYIIGPIIKLLKIGNRLSYEDSAKFIQSHLKDVDDKLLNILQLNSLNEENEKSIDLVLASIEQKSKELHPFNFNLSINLKRNLKFFFYFICLLSILSGLYLLVPSFVTKPTNRILKHGENFERPLPFSYKFLDSNFTVRKGGDFSFQVQLDGDKLPSSVILELGEESIDMKKEDINLFTYELNKINTNIQFRLNFGGQYTKYRILEIFPEPFISSYSINVHSPNYLENEDVIYRNRSEIDVYEGSEISLEFSCMYSDSIYLNDNAIKIDDTQNILNNFRFDTIVREDVKFKIRTSNQKFLSKEELEIRVGVMKDLFPVIQVEEFGDSIIPQRLFYNGIIEDDFGFHDLRMFVDVTRNLGSVENYENIIEIQKSNYSSFFESFDLSQYNLNSGDRVEIYFIARDNDQVNFYKKVKSKTFTHKIPGKEEIDKMISDSRNSVEKSASKILDAIKELNNSISELKKKQISEELDDWELEQSVNDLLLEKKALEKEFKELNDELIFGNEIEEEYDSVSERILEKQNLLQELFENLINDDFRQLLEQLEEASENFDKDKFNEMLDEMELSNEELEENLDRNIELFKQFEFDKKLDETLESLDNVLNKFNEDSDSTEDVENSINELNNDFEELNSLNDEMKKSEDLNRAQDLMEKGNSEFQKSKSSENKDQKSQSKKAFQNAKNILSNLKEKREQKENAEDANTLKSILHNLILVSYDQEELALVLKSLIVNDPKFQDVNQEQVKLNYRMDVVSDSLKALASRQVMISSVVLSKLNDINFYFKEINELIEDNNKMEATKSQQYVMTSMNDLALLLSEILKQMESSSMSGSGSGGDSKSKPGQGSSGMESLEQMQKQLEEQLKGLQQGKKPGQGSKGYSENLVRMAAKQAAIRQKLQEYQDEMKKSGEMGNKGLNEAMKMMEQNERDLINKRVTRQTIMRQQQIQTRLLQAKNAELEMEKEEKRESKTAIEIYRELFPEDKLPNQDKINGVEKVYRKMPVLKKGQNIIYKSYIKKSQDEDQNR